jgi:DNA-binding response OmpR family regulator
VAWFSGSPVSLRRQEVRLLQLLADRARQIVTYEQIAIHLYAGVSFECAHTRLKSLVADVRGLGEEVREWLRTVHGVGLILYTDTAAEAESEVLLVRPREHVFAAGLPQALLPEMP